MRTTDVSGQVFKTDRPFSHISVGRVTRSFSHLATSGCHHSVSMNAGSARSLRNAKADSTISGDNLTDTLSKSDANLPFSGTVTLHDDRIAIGQKFTLFAGRHLQRRAL